MAVPPRSFSVLVLSFRVLHVSPPQGLHFANGIVVDKAQDAVIVAELTRSRLTKVYIKGPRRGEKVTYIDNLPGFPDNLKWANDEIWTMTAIERRKSHPTILDYTSGLPLLRKIISKVRLQSFNRAVLFWRFSIAWLASNSSRTQPPPPSSPFSPRGLLSEHTPSLLAPAD